MKSLATVLVVFVLSIGSEAPARPPNFTWAKVVGGDGNDGIFGMSVGASSNLFCVGQFQSTAQFGTNYLIANSPGYSDIFVAKYDRNGNAIWARKAGGASEDYASAVAVNNLDEVFVTGAFHDTGVFSGFSAISSGIEDVFLTKYDGDGNVQWLRRAGGNGHDFATAIATRGTNGCYVTGAFQSTADFQGTDVTSLGIYDLFLAKYDAAGNLVWVRSAGGTNDERSLGVAVDAADDAIVTGYFASAAVSFGGIILTNQNTPFADGFLAKYDSAGNVLWAQRIVGDESERGAALAAGNAGEVYLLGGFASGTVTLGGIMLTNHGGSDLFLAKYSSSGGVLWARSEGGIGDELPAGLALDSAGNSYLAGSFTGIAEFGGVSITNNSPPGVLDAFAAKFDEMGGVLWAVHAGGSGGDYASGIGVDAAGNTYLGGSFESTSLTFGSSILTNRGGTDAFLAQIQFVQPILSLTRLNANVLLSWPAWHTGFLLQSSGVPGGGGWATVGSPAGRVGSQFVVTNSLGTTNSFYRLFHP